MKQNIAIIILNWNGWKDTIECLESLYQIDYPNYNIILVDNGSEDDSIQNIRDFCKGDIKIISKFFQFNPTNKPLNLKEYSKKEVEPETYVKEQFKVKDIILIKNETNYGFTEGNNIGIRFALKTLNPDYVLLLNNDTVVDKKFLSTLIDFANITESTVLQPKIKYYEDLTLNSTGIELDFFGYARCRGDHENDHLKYDNVVRDNFFYCAGACLLLKKEFLIELGDEYFDKKLFAYHEDVDICWLARLLGYKISYCPDSLCYHKGCQSTGGFGLKMAYWGWRNRIRVLIKNYSLKNLLISLPATLIIICVMSIIVSINRKDIRYIYTYIKSLIWNILLLNDTIGRRKLVQRKRRVDDSEITFFMVKHSMELFMLKKIFKSF